MAHHGLAMLVVAAVAFPVASAQAEIHIYGADHETGEVVKFKEDGTKLWSFPNKNSHDEQVLENGNVLINPGVVREVTPEGKIVSEVGKPIVRTAASCQRLANGNTMVADNAAHAVLDITPDKQVVWQYDVPGKPSMRQVRRLANGNTLISSGAGAGKQGYFLIEVDPAGKTVWKYGGDEAPADEQLNWPSGFVRMPDGTVCVSECRSARISVISPDRKSFRFITSPAMSHAATIALVDESL